MIDVNEIYDKEGNKLNITNVVTDFIKDVGEKHNILSNEIFLTIETINDRTNLEIMDLKMRHLEVIRVKNK